MKGILGRKLGMTQVFTTDGVLIPVTVVEACLLYTSCQPVDGTGNGAGLSVRLPFAAGAVHAAVSYTHLDVYKRQCQEKVILRREMYWLIQFTIRNWSLA